MAKEIVIKYTHSIGKACRRRVATLVAKTTKALVRVCVYVPDGVEHRARSKEHTTVGVSVLPWKA